MYREKCHITGRVAVALDYKDVRLLSLTPPKPDRSEQGETEHLDAPCRSHRKCFRSRKAKCPQERNTSLISRLSPSKQCEKAFLFGRGSAGNANWMPLR